MSLPLPSEISAEQAQIFIDFLGRSSTEFDREYMPANVQIHRKDENAASGQAQNDSDTGIRTFAQYAVPGGIEHASDRAQKILQTLEDTQP
jgi:predicted outer membrane protein